MSKPTTYDLEMLTPDELGILLIHEIWEISPDFQYIQDLLDVGCPLNRPFIFWIPLHCAAHLNKIEMVKFLISKGADVNAKDKCGNTAFDHADKRLKKKYPELRPK